MTGLTANWELPTDYYCNPSISWCPAYSNNLNYGRFYATNSWTDYIYIQTPWDIDIEPGGDFFCFRPGAWGDCLSGYLHVDPASPLQIIVNDPTGTNNPPGRISFITDGDGTFHGGIGIEGARVCSTLSSPRAWINKLMGLSRNAGFLLGTNDVIHFSFPVIPGRHASFALWTESPNFDADLYLRCGLPPTPTTWTQRSNSVDGMEYIDNSTCTGGTMYLAVHSYSGMGSFYLVPAYHLPNAHKTVKVSSCGVFTPDRRSQWDPELREAARLLYGATEGGVIIDKWQLWNANGCSPGQCGGADCNLVFRDLPMGGHSPICLPTSPGDPWVAAGWDESVWGPWERTRTVAHELLHQMYCQQDEYVTVGDVLEANCGHTIMADHYRWDQHNICGNLDHNTDPYPGQGPSPYPNGDQVATDNSKAGATIPSATDDNYSYSGFDFDGRIGTVEWK